MASDEHDHRDCDEGSVMSEHIGTDKTEKGHLLVSGCNEQSLREMIGEVDVKCPKTEQTASFDLATENQNVNEGGHHNFKRSVASLTINEVRVGSDKENLGYEDKVKVSDGSQHSPDRVKGNSSQKAQEHSNLAETTLTRPVSDSTPAAGATGTGNRHNTEDKENYQDINKSEVSSLDDWEHLQKSSLMEIPPIDPGALYEIEKHAREMARDLDYMLKTLASHLTAITKMDAKALGVYNSSIDRASSTVDKSVKGMYTLIAKCEELNSNMEPIAQIAAQIKDIKRALDVFEAMCK